MKDKIYKFMLFTLLVSVPFFGFSQKQSLMSDNPDSIVKMIYPNGGEVWEMNKTYLIKWDLKRYKGSIKLVLKWSIPNSERSDELTVLSNSSEINQTEFLVPDTGVIKPGDKFRVYLMGSNDTYLDSSDSDFSIIKNRESDHEKSISSMVVIKNMKDLKPEIQYKLNQLRPFLTNSQFNIDRVQSGWTSVIDVLSKTNKAVDKTVITRFFNPALINVQNRMLKAVSKMKGSENLNNQISGEIQKLQNHLHQMKNKTFIKTEVKDFTAIIREMKVNGAIGSAKATTKYIKTPMELKRVLRNLEIDSTFARKRLAQNQNSIQNITNREDELTSLVNSIKTTSDEVKSVVKHK